MFQPISKELNKLTCGTRYLEWIVYGKDNDIENMIEQQGVEAGFGTACQVENIE